MPATAFATTLLRRVLDGGVWRRRAPAALVLGFGLSAVATRSTAPDGAPTCHSAR